MGGGDRRRPVTSLLRQNSQAAGIRNRISRAGSLAKTRRRHRKHEKLVGWRGERVKMIVLIPKNLHDIVSGQQAGIFVIGLAPL